MILTADTNDMFSGEELLVAEMLLQAIKTEGWGYVNTLEFEGFCFSLGYNSFWLRNLLEKHRKVHGDSVKAPKPQKLQISRTTQADISEKQVEKLPELLSKMGYRSIAKLWGCSHSLVRRIALKHNIKINK